MNPLLSLVKSALQKPGANIRLDGNGDITQIIEQVPAVTSYLSLQTVVNPDNETGLTALGRIIEHSLVAQAGARLLVIPSPSSPQQNSEQRLEKLRAVASGFVTIEAAPFEVYPDDIELETSDKPYLVANYNDETGPIYGVGFKLSRRDIKDLSDGIALDAVMKSIEMGLANIVDHVLLTHLAGTASLLEQPNLKGIAKAAAARGLRFAELSAIAGGEMNSLELGGDGKLRSCGVVAEITKFSGQTIIGAFNRAAVGIDDELRLTAKRLQNGGVEVVAWMMTQAQSPDASAFWKV